MTLVPPEILARRIAAELGDGWTGEVLPGGRVRAISQCRRWKVHPAFQRDRLTHKADIVAYNAFLGTRDSDGGRYAASGPTPLEAITRAYDHARADIAEIACLLDPPPAAGLRRIEPAKPRAPLAVYKPTAPPWQRTQKKRTRTTKTRKAKR